MDDLQRFGGENGARGSLERMIAYPSTKALHGQRQEGFSTKEIAMRRNK